MSRASIKGSGRASLPAARRPRNSVQFDLSRNERDNSPVNDVPIPNNALTLFFSSFSDSCKNILPEFHTDLKMEILSAVAKYENKSREKQSSGRAIANGV